MNLKEELISVEEERELARKRVLIKRELRKMGIEVTNFPTENILELESLLLVEKELAK